MATRQEVNEFLSDFKAALTLGHTRWPKRSAKGKEHLAGLGITRDRAMAYLQGLKTEDYSEGPSPDDFEPASDVWTFGAMVDKTEAYIKVTLRPDPRKRTVTHAVIWSFHAAEYRIKYPLRESP